MKTGKQMNPGHTAILFVFLSLISVVHLFSEPNATPIVLKSSKGLRIKVIKCPNMQFYHAQLLIYYRDEVDNPAVPYLTMTNLLDPDVAKSNSPLSDTLEKLGNDFEVEHRPDFLIFKINFLPDKLGLFLKFLKGLYSYGPLLGIPPDRDTLAERNVKILPEDTFNNSVSNYWRYFSRKKDWKRTIAYQLAYQNFLPTNKMWRMLITPKAVKSVTFAQISSFYRSVYRLSNSLLVIKGNIGNPYILNGKIEVEFNSFKKKPPDPNIEDDDKLVINPEKKVLVFNTDNNDEPIIYWFEAVPTSTKTTSLPQLVRLVLNNILFSYPTGRLFITAMNQKIGYNSETEMVSHKNLSIICNTVTLNNKYKDIEKFILIVEREKKKLQQQSNRVDRNELLNTITNIYGRLKVNTRDYEDDVGLALADQPNPPTQPAQTYQTVLASLNEAIDEPERTVIVIVGNLKYLLPELTILKRQIEIIDFSQ